MMFASLVLSLAGLAQPVFADDPAQYSDWLQHGCRIQQVGHSGGEPVDHTAFCACFDARVSEAGGGGIYRAFALGMQGALREQSLIEDWEAARDTAAAEAGAMSLETQTGFSQILQNSLLACVHLSYQGE
ncbi:hypothetical protein [Maricaulis sp.]|uniref:hypothetical protein n=1 Tax=Maricaulis sp. TaxID=1486257 RepID=UPI003A93DD42